MASPNTLATADAFLKMAFTDKRVELLYQRDSPTLQMIEKKPITGSSVKVPMLTGRGAGISSSLAGANASAKGISSESFDIKMGQTIGIVPLATVVLLAAADKSGSFIDALKEEIEAKIKGFAQVHNAWIYGNGTGSLGRVSASAAGPPATVTLVNPRDTYNIYPDDLLVASAADGSGTTTLRVGSMRVLAVNHDTGQLVVDALATSLTANDYLFLDGAVDAGTNVIFDGLAKILNPTSPASDTLWGVNRANRGYLSGTRVPTAKQTGGPVERMKALSSALWQVGSRANCGLLSPPQWDKAAASLQNQGYRPITVKEDTATAGYAYIELTGYGGKVTLLNDPSLTQDVGYILSKDHVWFYHYDKKLVNFSESPDKSNRYVPSQTQLGYDVRLHSFPALVTNAPWMSGAVPLAPITA